MTDDEFKMMQRDDLDMDVAEKIVEIIQENHPGCTVVFVFGGDGGEIDQQTKQMLTAKAYDQGRCGFCGKHSGLGVGWTKAPEGWDIWEPVVQGHPRALCCPDCQTEGDDDGEN